MQESVYSHADVRSVMTFRLEKFRFVPIFQRKSPLPLFEKILNFSETLLSTFFAFIRRKINVTPHKDLENVRA